MALDIPVQMVFDLLGHDGAEIIWPGLPEPLKRRGFAFDELIHVAYISGYAAVPFSALFGIRPTNSAERYVFDPPPEYIASKLKRHKGVITGAALSGSRHAVAWDGNLIHDPCGRTYPLHDFNIEHFWALCPLEVPGC